MALGRAGVVRKRALAGGVAGKAFSFLFFLYLSKRPSIQSVGNRRGEWCCLLYKAATVVSEDNGKGKRRSRGLGDEMGSEFGAASVYSIAIAASLPKYWGGPTLALFQCQTPFFFD